MIIRSVDMEMEQVQKLIALIFLQLGEASHEAWIDIERFESRHWMSSHSGMMSIDRWSIWSFIC
jgi:hypothetical protein